ncbi:similar to Saccharomyces cerevisiae YCL004W PGS1 Phosphatidylglycerolphosphate synthase [Maudiozyma saulgeensis]|uniref:CDP-diacylglycerol--glycerol-3-phosphate 3-phosphatidyltransferase n=1 Tax=Maudiozyma saulgeensis TaxID=1789683 RepID=A0A1X7R8J1_9SACH|nr:similar to Saccharomyces cerevisiae YCL004W PGS1 Phosphatidylglycerolphosphate synthase [Kazachstania saulgeensis]
MSSVRSLKNISQAIAKTCSRHYSLQSSMSTTTTTTTTSYSQFDSFKETLSPLKTKFYLRKDEIEIMQLPSEFYLTLKQKITNAQNRIFFASLYLGKSEQELINCIDKAMESKPNLKVYFLLDGLRGTRETPHNNSSASLLANLVHKYGEDRINCRLYRTPAFHGWKKRLIPKRFNEGLGLQHMKIYGFDNELILSGANLSNDYFTNRQDRYYLFKCPPLTNYYFKLHQLIGSLSFKIEAVKNNINPFANYKLIWPKDNLSVNPTHLGNKHKFISDSSSALDKFLHTNQNMDQNVTIDQEKNYPTLVFPISQFTPLFKRFQDRSTEKPSVLSIISNIHHKTLNWIFTAGYFNMLPSIKHQLLKTVSENSRIITASQYANGFFESKGVSSNLPKAYIHLSHKFMKSLILYNRTDQIHLLEWQKGIVTKPGGWSYHAKGFWLFDDTKKIKPFLTIIGSSNYTKRAYSLDLESNVIILTKDENLQKGINSEVEHLIQDCHEVTIEDFKHDEDKHVGLGVKIATKLLSKRL